MFDGTVEVRFAMNGSDAEYPIAGATIAATADAGPIAALHLREAAHARPKLVRARRRVAGLPGPLTDEARGIDVWPAAEELAKQAQLVGWSPWSLAVGRGRLLRSRRHGRQHDESLTEIDEASLRLRELRLESVQACLLGVDRLE